MLVGANKNLMLFSGNANPKLATDVAKCLNVELGKVLISKFADGEIAIELLENVRGSDAFILQPLSYPTNDHLMEVLLLADALKRASAGRITAAIPYFGYSRQDRRQRSARVPISAKVIANMLVSAGVDRVLTIDLHAEQIQGFFDIPVDNIYASPVLLKSIRTSKYKNTVMISPDTGGVARTRAFAKSLNVDMAIIDKRRPKANEAEVMNIIGDIDGKTCIIVDDMIDTANTLCKAAEALKKNGALAIYAYATHPILSDNAIKRIDASVIDKVVVTDSIMLSATNAKSDKVQVVSIASLFAESIGRINKEQSVSSLLDEYN
jgi:ribose-phosphate pyrophosphokinase